MRISINLASELRGNQKYVFFPLRSTIDQYIRKKAERNHISVHLLTRLIFQRQIHLMFQNNKNIYKRQ